MASVSLKHINKTYPNGFVAVRDFSLEIADESFLVLVGPSGCGKSTTLRMIAGLETISSGTIEIDGRQVNTLPPKDRDIAMVFQNYALYPHMTVRENMAFALKLRHVAKAEIAQRVDEAAQILGLSALLDRLPKQLSGGQRQRVALGRAIVRKPKVFLFDEPLSNLDAKMRVEMREEIHRLHRHLKATIIYVTHDQVEAMTMGDQIVVMNEGDVCQVADPLTLYHEPTNQFSAGFIGSPPMNFLTMTRVGAWLSSPAGKIPCPEVIQEAIEDGQAIVVGVRPEDLAKHIQSAPLSDGGTIEASVDLIEHMGAEAYVHLKIDGIAVTARVPPNWPVGEGLRVFLAPEKQALRFFDPQTGLRIG